jgi:hypothetical protein
MLDRRARVDDGSKHGLAGLDLSFIGALSSSRSSMMRDFASPIVAPITRQLIGQQTVCLSPLNNERLGRLSPCLQARLRRHRVEAARLKVSRWPIGGRLRQEASAGALDDRAANACATVARVTGGWAHRGRQRRRQPHMRVSPAGAARDDALAPCLRGPAPAHGAPR